jgi:hypothetical protein
LAKLKKGFLEHQIGGPATRLALLGKDPRSALTNSTILEIIALNGPQWGYSIQELAQQIASDREATIPSQPSTFYRRIADLKSRGYIRSFEPKVFSTLPHIRDHLTHPGLPSEIYDLTPRGCLIAIGLPHVQERINMFARWRDYKDRLRLDALDFIGRLAETNASPKLLEHIINEAVRRTMVVFFDDTTDEEVRDIFYMNLCATLVHAKKGGKAVAQKLGTTDAELEKLSIFMQKDPIILDMMQKFKSSLQATKDLEAFVDDFLHIARKTK